MLSVNFATLCCVDILCRVDGKLCVDVCKVQYFGRTTKYKSLISRKWWVHVEYSLVHSVLFLLRPVLHISLFMCVEMPCGGRL